MLIGKTGNVPVQADFSATTSGRIFFATDHAQIIRYELSNDPGYLERTVFTAKSTFSTNIFVMIMMVQETEP